MGSWLPASLRERANVRQDVRICRQPYKEYFDEMCLGPVLDGDRTDTYQVTGESESGSRYGVKGIL